MHNRTWTVLLGELGVKMLIHDDQDHWQHNPTLGFGKTGLLKKGSFQKSPLSRVSQAFRDSRVSREPPDCGKQSRFRPLSRDSRELRDFRDSRDSPVERPLSNDPFSRTWCLLKTHYFIYRVTGICLHYSNYFSWNLFQHYITFSLPPIFRL